MIKFSEIFSYTLYIYVLHLALKKNYLNTTLDINCYYTRIPGSNCSFLFEVLTVISDF